jgi:excisionase family DNA binding protein
MNTQERYLTPNEVADTLRVTPRTIRNWLRNGKLPGVKLMGDNWVIPEEAVSMLLHPDGANTAASANGPALGTYGKLVSPSDSAAPDRASVAAPSSMANRKNKRR